jgi:hypothetical protein
MAQNDVMTLIIGKAVPATAVPTAAINTIVSDYSKLADGEMIITNSHGMVLSATSVLTDDIVAESGIKIMKRNGTDVITSDLIKQGNILGVKPVAYAAAVEQVSYIGYNGTSGAIDVANSKLYVIRISLQETDITGQGQQWILNAPFKSDATATQVEIALGLVQQLSRLFRRQAVQPVSPVLVCDVAYAATARFAHDCTIVSGEYYVTVGTNSQYNTSTELVVGDYVRINPVSTTTGCAVTNSIYKVTELTSGTVFKVDRPIEAPSGTYPTLISGANKGARVTVLTAAKIAASTQFGIKLTGLARTFTVGKTPYSKVSFLVGLDSSSSFNTTTVTYTTKMSLGQGTYEQVAEREWNLLGNDGNAYPGDFMWTAARALAVSGQTYHLVGINYFENHSTGGIGAQPRRMKQLLLALPSSFDNNDSADILLDILAAYTTQAMTGITA